MAERDPVTGQFKRGNKAAQGGRPAQRRNTAQAIDAFERAISVEERAQFLRECWIAAQDGDDSLKEMFLSRLMPDAPKPRPTPVALGEFNPDDPGDAIRTVMMRLQDGTLAPTEAKDILQAINSAIEAAMTLQLGPQMQLLQEQLGGLLEAKS